MRGRDEAITVRTAGVNSTLHSYAPRGRTCQASIHGGGNIVGVDARVPPVEVGGREHGTDSTGTGRQSRVDGHQSGHLSVFRTGDEED